MPALTSLSPSLQPSTMCSGGGGEKSCSRSGQAGGPQDPRGVWCHRVRAARPLQLDGRGGRGRKGAAEGPGLAPAGMGSAGMGNMSYVMCMGNCTSYVQSGGGAGGGWGAQEGSPGR